MHAGACRNAQTHTHTHTHRRGQTPARRRTSVTRRRPTTHAHKHPFLSATRRRAHANHRRTNATATSLAASHTRRTGLHQNAWQSPGPTTRSDKKPLERNANERDLPPQPPSHIAISPSYEAHKPTIATCVTTTPQHRSKTPTPRATTSSQKLPRLPSRCRAQAMSHKRSPRVC